MDSNIQTNVIVFDKVSHTHLQQQKYTME